MHEINDNDFAVCVLGSPHLVLVDAYAPWCGPCHVMSPILERFAAANPDVVVYKMNIDESGNTTMQYRIDKIPSLLWFKDGKEVKRMVGVQSENILTEAARGLQ
jgi:thioredoxin 1